jgi:hypothetical protein
MSGTNKGKVALYIRVSQKGKREGEKFQSPGQQKTDATRHAAARGFDVSQVFDDTQSVQGSTPFDDRPGLSRALAAIEAGKLDGLVVATQCRIARPDRKDGDLIRLMQERIRSAGAVLLVADNPSAEVLDAEKELPTGYEALPTDMRGLVDRAVREESAKRWLKAQANAIERGVHFCRYAPVGYLKNTAEPKVSGEARKSLTREERWADPCVGQLVIDPVAGPLIQGAFQMRYEKVAWGVIMEFLRGNGVIAAGTNYGTLTSVMKNRAYLGEAFHGDMRNPDAHPPLVDPAVWRECQPAPDTRTRSSEGYLLTGLCKCGCCGRTLTSGAWYRCRPKLTKGPECLEPATVKAAEIEPRVEDFLALTVAAAQTPSRETVTADTSALKLKLAAAQGAKAKVYSLESILAADQTQLKALIAETEAAVKEAEDALRNAEAAGRAVGEIKSVLEAWPEMSVSERRRWLRKLGCRVVVRRGKQHVGVRADISFSDSAYAALGITPDAEARLVHAASRPA